VVVDDYDEGRLAEAVVSILERGERSDGATHASPLALDAIAARVRRVYEEALAAS
jgi:hypothetical protein